VTSEIRPYLVPLPDTVRWGAWELFDGDWGLLPSEVEGWDSGTDLRIRRSCLIDVGRFRSETGVDVGAVVVTVSWQSSTTSMRGAAASVRPSSGGFAQLDAVLPAERVSGTVSIRSTVSLASPGSPALPGVARLPGSVLSEDRVALILDRGDQLFPVDAIDFASTRLAPEASWHLETSIDLEGPFFGSFRVLLNTRDSELVAAVARGQRDRRQDALVDELEGAVAAQLIEFGLGLRNDLDQRTDWPENSTGEVLCRALAALPPPIPQQPSACDAPAFRTQLSALVRRTGRGRLFR